MTNQEIFELMRRAGENQRGHRQVQDLLDRLPFILFLLENCGEDGSFEMQKELSKRLRISPASVTAALKALEKQGCIVREAQESDMRRKRIRITDKGREVALRYKEVFTEVDEAMYRGFSDEELRAVSAYFERITRNLRALCEQEDGQC